MYKKTMMAHLNTFAHGTKSVFFCFLLHFLRFQNRKKVYTLGHTVKNIQVYFIKTNRAINIGNHTQPLLQQQTNKSPI